MAAVTSPLMPQRRGRRRRVAAVMLLDGFRAAPGYMAFMTCLIVLGSVASTCYPLGYRLLIDGALAHSTSRVLTGALVVGGLLSVGWLLTSIGATEAMALGDRIALWRTARLIRLISGVTGLEHLERPDYLNQVERINANRRQLAGAPRQLLRSVASIARIAVLLVLLAEVTPWLLLLPLSAVPPILAGRAAKRIGRTSEDAMADDRRRAAGIFALCSDVNAAAELRVYGLSAHLRAEHERLSRSLDRSSGAEALRVLGVQLLGWFAYAGLLMGAIGFVVVRAAHGHVSLGAVVETVSLIRRSRTQLAQSAQTTGSIGATLTTVDRVLWLEDHAAAEAALSGHLEPPPRLTGGLRLEDVSFCYPGTEREVLRGLTLDLPAGSTVAVVGENGAGKTTLAKLLLGMYRPTAGRITVDGVPLADLDPAGWRLRCTAAFQDFSRLHLPAVESIGVADLDRIAQVPPAEAALARAGAEDLGSALPEGLATEVGSAYTGGHGLSGGQWQKLALARAMRRDDPLLVVLDEPTASLDAAAEHALFTRYGDAAAAAAAVTGAVTVLVSHRFSTVRSADVIVYLQDGSPLEVGSHDELMATGGEYAKLYQLQAAGYR